VAVGASFTLWLATVAINGWLVDSQPRAFLGYAGFLTGIVLARPIELSIVDFDPRSSKPSAKLLRFVISVAMVLAALIVLEKLFRAIAIDYSVLGYLLQYIRYTIAGVVSVFVAPLFFTRLGLAERNAAGSAEATSRLNFAL